MPVMPFTILGIWLRGLLALAILAGGVALLGLWYNDAHAAVAVPEPRVAVVDRDRDRPADAREPAVVAVPERRVFRFEPGWNRPTAELAGGVVLLTWALLGGLIARGLLALTLSGGGGTGRGQPPGADDPKPERTGEVQRLRRPDGSEIRVETYGPAGAPLVVLTHGWGADSEAWYYVKTRLARRFRVVVWDLPGLGLSKKPDNNDFRLEKYAADLDAVLQATSGKQPAILVGHSIGGMITLTYCRVYPDALGTRVAGLVLANTTYTDPVKTAAQAPLYSALEKPVLVPLLHLTIWLWPLVWAMNWLSYLNGSVHRSTHKSSFAGTETKGQLDFVAGKLPRWRPDVLARGMFAMMHYDATATLPTIGVPVQVVTADGDTTTTPEASQLMARSIPRAELVTVAPGRHMAVMERHAEFDAGLAGFVTTHLATGAASV